jgi:hypothetical protein
MLLHSSGEWIRGHIELKPMRQVKDTGWVASEDPQSYGSCITYARRYAMAAITGVATEDDDGNAATGRTAQDAPVSNPPPEAKAPPASPPPPVPAEAPSSATQNDTRAELAIVCSKIADIMKTDAGTVLYHLTVNKDGKYGKRNPMDILWEAKGPKGPWSPLKAILSKAKESLVELQKPPDDNVLGDVDDPEWIK